MTNIALIMKIIAMPKILNTDWDLKGSDYGKKDIDAKNNHKQEMFHDDDADDDDHINVGKQ